MVVLDHETTLTQQDCHPLFLTFIWRKVLKCFPLFKAMHLDTIFGGFNWGWLIQYRMIGLPGPNDWSTAMIEKSLGMMIYLMEYKIPCPHLANLLQYAVDHNLLDVVVFILDPNHPFYHETTGARVRKKPCPTIDEACRQNYTIMVRYLLYYFGASAVTRDSLLHQPPLTLTQIMRDNFLELFRLVVPLLTDIRQVEGLRLAAARGHRALLRYACQHLNPNHFQGVPETVGIAAVQEGQLECLKICQEFGLVLTPILFDAAFASGYIPVVEYLCEQQPNFRPSSASLVAACTRGFTQLILALPETMLLPPATIPAAIKSGQSELVYYLVNKLGHYQFNEESLVLAIQSGSSLMVMTIFECGGFQSLSAELILEMTRYRLAKALHFFHQRGLTVYTEAVLQEAARLVCLPILKNMMSLGLNWGAEILQRALNKIYVSFASQDDKTEAYSLLNQHLLIEYQQQAA